VLLCGVRCNPGGRCRLQCSLTRWIAACCSSSSSSNRSSWQAAVHAVPGGAQVVVDVLAPAAIHADAAVKLHVSYSLLTVTLTGGTAKNK
jgi:hypothetical protein